MTEIFTTTRNTQRKDFKPTALAEKSTTININVFPFRCSAVYKLDNTTCSSMQLTCGRWYLPNKDPVQCR